MRIDETEATLVESPKQLAFLMQQVLDDEGNLETNYGEHGGKAFILIRLAGEGSEVHCIPVTALLAWSCAEFVNTK